MNSRADRMLVIGFVFTLFLMSIAFFLLPSQRFSELENRYLQTAPHFTWGNLFSKKYTDEAERYVVDQFPFRNQWIAVKSTIEQLRLQQENNGIYMGKDGYLFEKFMAPDYVKVEKYTDALMQFAKNHQDITTTFMLAPTSVGMYPERLPLYAPNYPQTEVNQFIADRINGNIAFLDGFDFLRPHAMEPIYYRTDHHWTTHGAYLAYAAFAASQGWQPIAKEQFQIETVSNSFLGSYHTKSQFTSISPDSIEVYRPITPVHSTMYVADTGESYNSLYDKSFLEKKDQYSYFQGGVHALMTLTSKLPAQQIDLEKLLVIKDSYAHNVLPFLTLHVPEIHVIDMRYYNGSISDYIAEHGINDVLFLFNTTTFIDNPDLLKLKN